MLSLLVDERASARVVDVGIYAGVDYWRADDGTYAGRAAAYRPNLVIVLCSGWFTEQ